MHEDILRRFMLGECETEELRKDLAGSVQTGRGSTHYVITDMDAEFPITHNHLIRVCDAVLTGELDPQFLDLIGFCIMASESFEWAESQWADRISKVLHDWATPQINYPLTLENVRNWRHLLDSGDDPFARAAS